jgi:hypothetical protein
MHSRNFNCSMFWATLIYLRFNDVPVYRTQLRVCANELTKPQIFATSLQNNGMELLVSGTWVFIIAYVPFASPMTNVMMNVY